MYMKVSDNSKALGLMIQRSKVKGPCDVSSTSERERERIYGVWLDRLSVHSGGLILCVSLGCGAFAAVIWCMW